MLSLYDLLVSYMTLSLDEPTKFEQICARFQTIADAFHLDSLHPGILLSCYLAAAQGWSFKSYRILSVEHDGIPDFFLRHAPGA